MVGWPPPEQDTAPTARVQGEREGQKETAWLI